MHMDHPFKSRRPAGQRTNGRRRGPVGRAAVGILLAFLSGLAPLASAAADAAPTVTLAEARPTAFVTQVPVTGTLTAREEVMVNPRIAGRIITALDADIGDHVEQGAPLAELDSATLEVQLEQAEAEQARAEASVRQAQSQVALSQANLDNAATDRERNRQLRASGTISQAILDKSETAWRTAKASLSAAKDGLAVARAQVQQAEAQVKLARLTLSYTHITAPVAGIVAQRNARLGAVAVAGAQPMFSIIAKSEIELAADVLETDVNALHPGDPVRVSVAGIGAVSGKVRLIPPSVDPRTRLASVRISLAPTPGLKSGTFARGTIEAARFTALSVPVSAILSDGGRDHVLLVDADNIVRMRDVETGAVWQGQREIVRGLAAGDRVLKKAGPFFQDGDKVTPAHSPIADAAPEAGQ